MVNYPDNWKKVPVKKFGQILTGSTPSTIVSKYWNGEYIWITPTDINKTIFMRNSERKLTSEGYDASRKLESGSVLVTCIASIGKNCILYEEGSCNQQINAIVVNENYYNLFIYYLMEHSKNVLENLAGITATKILKKQDFEEIEFTVPKLNEQKAIAEALMAFDGHIENLEELIVKKKMIRDGAAEDLMSGKTRLDGFDGEWKEVLLGDFLEFKNGLNKSKDFFGYGIPIINYMDVYKYNAIYEYSINGKVSLSSNEINRYKVKKGDVFFTRTSETPEEVGISSVLLDDIDNCVFSGFILRGRPKNKLLIPEYCKYCFNIKSIRTAIIENATFTTRALTNGKQLSKIPLCIPANKQEQKAIADILTAMDEEIEDLKQEKDKIEKIKAGAMDDLLTGKIRLVKEA